MSTATKHDIQDAPKAPQTRDDDAQLASIAHLGLIHDKTDHLTPIDRLFNKSATSAKPKREPREIL